MTTNYPLSLLLSVILLLSVAGTPSPAPPPAPELVSSVCHATTNYTFCVTSLLTDPRAATADAYGLAFVAFGMAYFNASATQDIVAGLIGKGGALRVAHLETCRDDYAKAAAALEMAYNDLNSETFFELADLSNRASLHARHCQLALRGAGESPLAARNHALKGLCEICVAVSKLFTGGFY